MPLINRNKNNNGKFWFVFTIKTDIRCIKLYKQYRLYITRVLCNWAYFQAKSFWEISTFLDIHRIFGEYDENWQKKIFLIRCLLIVCHHYCYCYNHFNISQFSKRRERDKVPNKICDEMRRMLSLNFIFDAFVRRFYKKIKVTIQKSSYFYAVLCLPSHSTFLRKKIV